MSMLAVKIGRLPLNYLFLMILTDYFGRIPNYNSYWLEPIPDKVEKA